MGVVELLRVKRTWGQLRIAHDVRIILAEDHLVLDTNLNARRHPSSRHLAIIFKTDVLKLGRIRPRGFEEPHE
jgi:hypothetical protein